VDTCTRPTYLGGLHSDDGDDDGGVHIVLDQQTCVVYSDDDDDGGVHIVLDQQTWVVYILMMMMMMMTEVSTLY
jgi:hypothetical protein